MHMGVCVCVCVCVWSWQLDFLVSYLYAPILEFQSAWIDIGTNFLCQRPLMELNLVTKLK